MNNDAPALTDFAGWRERLIDLIRHHPFSFGLFVLTISVLTGLIVSLKLTLDLTRERDNLLVAKRALQKEVNTSNEVVQLLTGIFKAADPNQAQGKTINAQTLVDVATEQTQKKLDNRPEVKARLLRSLGNVQQLLGSYDKGIALLEQAQQLDKSKDPYDIAQLAEGYRKVRKMHDAGNWLENIIGQKADNAFEQSEIDRIIGEYYRENGKPKEALKYFQQAYRYWQNFDGEIGAAYISSQMNLAVVYNELFESDKALPFALAAEKNAIALFGENHPRNIRIQSWLSILYRELGEIDKAGAKAKLAYQLAGDIYDPNNMYYNNIVTHLAYFYRARGQYQKALNVLEFELAKSLENPSIKGFYLTDSGAIHLNMGRYKQALQNIEKGNDILIPLYKDNIAYLHTSYVFGGMAWGLNGELEKSLRVLDEGYQLAVKAYGESTYPVEMFTLAKLKVLIAQNQLDGIEPQLKVAREIFEKAFPAGHESLLTVYEIEADYYLATNNWQKARETIELCLAIAEKAWDEQTVGRLMFQLKLGQALWHLGERESGRKMVLDNIDSLQQMAGRQSNFYYEADDLAALVEGL